MYYVFLNKTLAIITNKSRSMGGFVFYIMKKKKQLNYVKCDHCSWRREQKTFDPHTELCRKCNNTQEVIDPKEILCNLCGECMCPLGTHNEQYPLGLYNANVYGGYESYHLFDDTAYNFNLCEKCLRQIFIQCKIKPNVSDSDNFYDDDNEWERDLKYYEYRIWKDTGGHHQAYLNSKCNVEKDCPNDAVYSVFLNGEFTEDCHCELHKESIIALNQKLVPFVSSNLRPFL